MKRVFAPVFAIVLLLFIFQLACSLSAFAAGRKVHNRFIIGYFNPPGGADERDVISRGGNVRHRYRAIPAIAVEINENAIQGIRKNPNVRYIEPDYEVHILETPNDPMFNELWGLHNTGQTGGTPDADIDAPEAWGIETGNENVVIAVIDTGVDYNHSDLANNMWVNGFEISNNGLDDDGNGFVDDVYGWDFCNGDKDPMDDHSHGTHCSGTIAAVGNNTKGVVGVNWNASIMALKFLDASGYGSTSDAVAAADYAIMMKLEHYVPVIALSNSWGGGGYSQAMADVIDAADTAGILFVAAAGNDGANNDSIPHYPSSYELPNVIAVAATDHNDALAWFSCYGPESVDLAAPGVSILSTVPGNGYSSFNGTSMATPHVSGVVGLLNASLPEITHLEIKQRILNSVDPKPGLTGMMVTGGRLNAYSALTITPEPQIVYDSHSVDDGPEGNGAADPGETVDVIVTLGNSWVDATNVNADLISADPYVTVTSAVASFGDIPAGATASNFGQPYTVDIDANCPDGYIATLNLDITADGGYMGSDTFNLMIYGDIQILFVDDDAGNSYEYHFTDALEANGYPYIMWDVAVNGSPSAADMIPFWIVIWNTGFDYVETLSASDQNELAAYLDSGGSLFFSSQDVLYDIGFTPFIDNYLHVSDYTNDVGADSVAGIPGDPVSQDMNLILTYPFYDFSDYIAPDPGANAIFINETASPCALKYPGDGFSGTHKVVFLAFPFEAISANAEDPNNQKSLMRRIVEWLQPGEPDTEPPIISGAAGNISGTTGEPVEVFATITDNIAVASATAHYKPIDGAETDVPMTKDAASDTWRADIPVASDKTGNITYYITAQDAAGNSATDPPSGTYEITVTDNDPPVAEAGPDQSVLVGTVLSFDGSGSSDNIAVTSWSWNFGDSGENASGETATHTYETTGIYVATLTVGDDAGNTASDTLEVTVNEDTPGPTIFTVNSAFDGSGTVNANTAKEQVIASDDKRLQIEARSFAYFSFLADGGIPAEAGIASAVVCVEHQDEIPFKGNIEWVLGTDFGSGTETWASNPDVPIHRGETTDKWDVTQYVTRDKLESMELRINNNSTKGKITYTNYVYIEVQWGAPDTNPPAAVTDLTPGSPTASSVVLTWTAPGDDGETGTASQYDVRYSEVEITDTNWDSTTPCSGEPVPSPAGSAESFTVTGLSPDTKHYFALKTRDEEADNWSELSNVVEGTTSNAIEMHVANTGNGYDFEMTLGNAGPNTYANATVAIVDGSNQAVPEAEVRGTWEVTIADSTVDTYAGSALTDAAGNALLKSSKIKSPDPGTVFRFTVDNVIKAGWFYDSTISPSPSDSVQVPLATSEEYLTELMNIYPSPGNPEVWIPYALSEMEHVVINIYDATGRLVRTLDLGRKAPGGYASKDKAAHWDGKNMSGEEVSSGIYFCIMRAGEFVSSKKLLIAK